jgi:hypothetical protein
MRTDRHAEFGLTEADDRFYRAVRDGFRASGLGRAQLTEALTWYRDHGQQLGGDATKLAESFSEFVLSKGWSAEHLVAATSVQAAIQERGPDAVIATPTPDEDRATIERATELLRKDADAYWRDTELQELQLEAIERQQAAPSPVAAEVDHYAIERQIAHRDMQKFETMMREEPQKYWASPEAQAAYRDAIERSTISAPPAAPAEPPAEAEPGPVAAHIERSDAP